MSGPAGRGVLRVASYNIHGAVGRDRRRRPQRIADVLAELDADVIALQEVDSRRKLDQFEFFREATGFHAVAGPNLIEERGAYGNVLLSRHEPVRIARHSIGVKGCEPRGVLDVDFRIEGLDLRVVTTHLGLMFGERDRQIRMLAALLEAQPMPLTVFLGDFNVLRPHAGALSALGHPLGLRRRAPATFPASCPVFALDRVWTVPNSFCVGVRAHRSPLARRASDHLPVVGDLLLASGTAELPEPHAPHVAFET